jgi:gamma-glutamylaminecyclotransferase|tara:strand:- start:1018 stop:1416 length:399 start_codon:yes stop_codon:yes gene_type:complete
MDYYVFVYGTLKKGGGLHGALAGEQSLGDAKLDGFGLYDLGWFPGIVEQADCKPVQGEVYRVSAEKLAELDSIEGCPSLYRRAVREVRMDDCNVASLRLQGSDFCQVYIYNGTPPANKRIVSGLWPVDGGDR